MTNDNLQVAMTESSEAISYDGKRETLLASETFCFNPLVLWNFIWLIPVPSKPTVELINADFLVQVEKIGHPDAAAPSPRTRPVNIAWYKVFAPQPGMNDLKRSLNEIGIYVPKRLQPTLDEYASMGWHFVAFSVDGVHIHRDAAESLALNTAHTLPIKISFDTDRIVCPLKFASVEPDIDSSMATLAYGLSAEKAIGVKSAEVDALLAGPSPNRYPRLPLGASNVKIDLYVFSDRKAEAAGFNDLGETSLDGKKFGKGSWNAFYLNLPPERLILTHLGAFMRLEDLDDIEISLEKAPGFYAAPFNSARAFVLRNAWPASLIIGLLSFIFGAFAGGRLGGGRKILKAILPLFPVAGFGFLLYGRSNSVSLRSPGTVSNGNGPLRQIGGTDGVSPAVPRLQMASARDIALECGDFGTSPERIVLLHGEKVRLQIRSAGPFTFTVRELGIKVKAPGGPVAEVEFIPVRKGVFGFSCDAPKSRVPVQRGTILVQ